MGLILTQSSIRTSIQGALLGAITPNVRAIWASFEEKKIVIDFFYESPWTDEEEDLSEIVSSEVVADFTDCYVESKRSVLPYPEPIHHKGINVFLKKSLQITPTVASVKIALQIALLGFITPSLRSVMFEINNNLIKILFYYDQKITKEDEILSTKIANRIDWDYPMHHIELQRIILSYPASLSMISSHRVYHRYEKTPE